MNACNSRVLCVSVYLRRVANITRKSGRSDLTANKNPPLSNNSKKKKVLNLNFVFHKNIPKGTKKVEREEKKLTFGKTNPLVMIFLIFLAHTCQSLACTAFDLSPNKV